MVFVRGCVVGRVCVCGRRYVCPKPAECPSLIPAFTDPPIGVGVGVVGRLVGDVPGCGRHDKGRLVVYVIKELSGVEAGNAGVELS